MKKFLFFIIASVFATFVFSQDAKITDIKVNMLPKEAQKFVANNLPGTNISRAAKIEEKGVLSYLAVVEIKGQKHAYLFDKDGKFTGKGDKYIQPSSGAKPPAKTQVPKPAAQSPTPGSTTPKK